MKIRTGFGEVMVRRVEGDADVKTGSGRIDMGSVAGSAAVRNWNGDTRIGEVEGRAQLQNANGRSKWTALARTSRQRPLSGTCNWGCYRRALPKPRRPAASRHRSSDGVLAWLDLSTGFGRVNKSSRTQVAPSGRPSHRDPRAHGRGRHQHSSDAGSCRNGDEIMSTAPTIAIATSRVCKSFGSHLVLDKVNLTADESSILALLGPNGAGKTTIVRILSTLIPADSGSMHIAGHNVITKPYGVGGSSGSPASSRRRQPVAGTEHPG